MSSTFITFFQKHLALHADEVDAHIKARRARLASAALLVEVVNADGEVTADERRALFDGVRAVFSLSEAEATELLALAETQFNQAVDLHQFTTLINQHFSLDQKLELIEELWRAAYADSVLHKHEEHLIRKIGDLLHVPHMRVLAAKHRVQAEGN
ncbi:MAG TPA: TerB family tellurite resistance protein [Steroidobacteraceae bacterium]|nr:TerB family tellurite resistance protein [Steroidobacteraceae bacterium]